MGDSCPECGTAVEAKKSFCPQCGHRTRTLKDSSDPLIGRTIADKYRIDEVLGSGAMGCIYLAQHMALDRLVALKVLHPHLVNNENMVMRFMREARAASRLQHPNIITLLDFGQDGVDGLLYLVMEYLAGRSLQVILDEEGPLELPRVYELARQILLAVDEAHEQGVVHRDLKPENIFVLRTRLGEEAVKVLDFGLAQMLEGDEVKLTAPGLICGTPSYISPEQAKSPEVGTSTDIYSFGVILYEMSTGVLPFAAKTAYEMVAKHLTEPAPHPADRAPMTPVPEPLAQVMLQCLEKEPDKRFPNAIELLEALKRAIGAATAPTAPRNRIKTITGAEMPKVQVSDAPEPPSSQELPPVTDPGATLDTAQPEVQVCTACGSPMPSEGRFCGVCGQPLPGSEPGVKLSRPSPSSEVNLFGRGALVRRIEQAGSDALGGRGSAWLMEGEAGIGRSSLLRYAADVVRGLGLQTHLVQARHHDGRPGVIGALICSLLGCGADADDDEVRERLADLQAGALDAADRRALVAMVSRVGSPGLTPEALSTSRATALRRLLRVRSAGQPLAILLDDVSCLEGAELALIEPLTGVTAVAPILLLLTDISAALPAWSQRDLEPLALGPLHPEDSRRLIERLVGDRRLHEETIERLVEASGGSPLYLVETVRFFERLGLLDTGRSARQRKRSPSWTIQIPSNVRALVRSQLEVLDAAARQALFSAAVLGRSFTLELLSQVAQELPQLDEVVTQLCQQGLLERVRRGHLPPRYLYKHELVRAAVYDGLQRKEKRSIHDRVATALLTRSKRPTSSEEIGNHLEQAARYSEASELFARASDEQVQESEPAAIADVLGRAVAALERSLALDTGSKRVSLQRVVNLKVKLAQALNQARQWDRAKPVALEARNAAMAVGDALLAAQASRELARAAAEQGDHTLASSVLKESYEAALECGDLELASDIAADLSDLREEAGQLDKAIGTLTGALQRLEAVSRRSKLSSSSVTIKVAEVLNRLGRVSLRAENLDDATRYLREALELARGAGDEMLTARVLGNLGNALAISGDTPAALEALEKALETMQQVGDRLSSAKLLHNLACLYLQAGERDAAADLARRSLDLSVEIGWGEGTELGSAFLAQMSA